MERRDQVLITRFSPDESMRSTLRISFSSTYGPFLSDRAIAYFFLLRRINLLEALRLARVRFPLVCQPHGERG